MGIYTLVYIYIERFKNGTALGKATIFSVSELNLLGALLHHCGPHKGLLQCNKAATVNYCEAEGIDRSFTNGVPRLKVDLAHKDSRHPTASV